MSVRVVLVLILIWTVLCASGSGYYGSQFGYESYGWIGAVIGAVIGAIIGGIVGGFIGAILFGWGDFPDEEESWGKAFLKVLGILSLLIVCGVCWGVSNQTIRVPQTIQYLGWGIALLIFLVFTGYIIWDFF